MITGPRVLDTESVPSDLLHRHNKLNTLRESLVPAVYDGISERSYVFGPSGSGKTCLARYSLADLKTERQEVDTRHINAWQQQPPFAFLSRLVDGVGPAHEIDQRSTSHDALLDRVLERDGQLFVVVRHEVDQLDAPELLYDINWMPHVHLILIAI
ncbi:hypothetical protein [Haloglomus litoreum]|uniref:hypothetical protein n=1 Tax=Haloglomus litoreum TaxID=3034026 RepID=UPI0023E7D144|nr:hypothetical protein [Haloglomus sp. DT116]